MRKLFLTVGVSFLILQLVSAQTVDLSKTTSTQTSHDIYIEKYKTNRTIGRVLLWSGIGMTVTYGIILAAYANQGFNGAAPVQEEALLYLGSGAALASIPFFISAKRNKKSAAVSLKGESITFGRNIPYKSNYIAVALTVPL